MQTIRYKSQKIAYWFFAACMLLFSLQLIYGFILGFARMGFDGLHEWIPFNVARATHTNLLVVWLLAGFMGSAYYIIPEESERELWAPKLAWIQLVSLLLVGVAAIVGYHFNWWEGPQVPGDPQGTGLTWWSPTYSHSYWSSS